MQGRESSVYSLGFEWWSVNFGEAAGLMKDAGWQGLWAL